MALDDDIRLLSGVALFESLAEEHLRLLAFGAEKMSLRTGETLYSEGEPALCAYVIMSGRIEIYRERDGEHVKLAEAGPGTVLGELAVIAPTQRLSSAMALVETRVMAVDRKSFRRVLEEYPELPELIHRRIAGEFQAMVEKLEKLTSRLDD
ncbi:MAG: cyclic nucleotide-binding domain-containing protein [Rhizobiaceae bacterium]|nr:cyclic nucleotide-binding domain-containing protein [Rhizobiaceae bacterium]